MRITLTDGMVGQRLRAFLAQAFGDAPFTRLFLGGTTASPSLLICEIRPLPDVPVARHLAVFFLFLTAPAVANFFLGSCQNFVELARLKQFSALCGENRAPSSL